MQVAYTVGWTAVSSELTYYTSLFGPEILLWLNVSACEPFMRLLAHGSVLRCAEGTDNGNGASRWLISCRLYPS